MTEFRRSHRYWSRLPRRGLVAAVVAGSLLAGCASPSLPSFSSMFGSGSTAGNANAAATPTIALPSNFECPAVNVRSGASTLTSSAEAGEPTATGLGMEIDPITGQQAQELIAKVLATPAPIAERVRKALEPPR